MLFRSSKTKLEVFFFLIDALSQCEEILETGSNHIPCMDMILTVSVQIF